MCADHGDPRELAAAIRAQLPMTPGTLTSTMSRADHRVGLFLRELTRNGVRPLPGFSASTHPQLISADSLLGGDHATIGAAFGWLIRLQLVDQPQLIEAQIGRDLLPPHIQIALWKLDRWINSRPELTEPRDLERVAIVLAWCEQLFRAGPAALLPCPLLRLRADAGPADLLDLVQDPLVDQLAQLGTLAATELLAPFSAARRVRLGCPLGRQPIVADADMVVEDVLLELKCTQGAIRAAGRTFCLGVDLIRQLLGYLLLDREDDLGAQSVGVYAARFGLLWTMPADELITTVSGRPGDLTAWREAFGMLWNTA